MRQAATMRALLCHELGPPESLRAVMERRARGKLVVTIE